LRWASGTAFDGLASAGANMPVRAKHASGDAVFVRLCIRVDALASALGIQRPRKYRIGQTLFRFPSRCSNLSLLLAAALDRAPLRLTA
jgi:hypothetical protein